MKINDHSAQAIETLSYLNECHQRNIPPPQFAVEYLSAAIAQWAAGKPLNEAFGVYDTSTERKHRRNKKIAEYASLLQCSQTQKAKIIAGHVKKLEAGRQCDPVIKDIYQIEKIPATWRQVLNILRN